VRRRDFISLLGCAVAWPLAARAQQPAIPVVGFLGSESRTRSGNLLRFFHQGLGELGFVEGQNLAIDYRWADGQNDRLPALAEDLVRRKVSVIAAPATTPGALADLGDADWPWVVWCLRQSGSQSADAVPHSRK
jgi:putative tryptophan/tyrosine transport system substrate-binding protein